MTRDFVLPGYVAIGLAVLFPLYWFSGLLSGLDHSLVEAFRADATTLSPMDALFVLIGLMEVYIYMSLRQLLLRKLDGALAAGLSLCVAIVVGLFTTTVLFDVFLAATPELSGSSLDRMLLVVGMVMISISVLVGVVGLLLSISLLCLWRESSVLLRLFSILLLVCSLLTVTVILAPVVFLLYPVALLVLAAVFIRDGGEVEVV